MADYKPGDVVYALFTTRIPSTSSGSDADSTPTGVVNRNGTDDGAVTVTVTKLDTGRYKATFTIPATYLPGDVVNLSITATVDGVTDKANIWGTKLGVGWVARGTASAGGSSTITLQSALGADNVCRRMTIFIVSGTGAGQARNIAGYVDSTKVVTVDRAWVVNPDSTSVYVVIYSDLPSVDATGSVRTTSNIKKNQALDVFMFMMTDSTNHRPVTGKTVSAVRSIDGGEFSAGNLGSVQEVAGGWYSISFSADDLNGDCISLTATADGCDDTFERIITQP